MKLKLEIGTSTPSVISISRHTMSSSSSCGSGRGRGRGSRPGPPAWPHGTAPENRKKFVANILASILANKSDKICEPVEVDGDEMRQEMQMVSVHFKYGLGLPQFTVPLPARYSMMSSDRNRNIPNGVADYILPYSTILDITLQMKYENVQDNHLKRLVS